MAQSRVWFGYPHAAGPTAYTLTCDAGAFTLTGQDAALNRGFVLACDAGAFTLTGQDAALNRGYILDCEAGAYTLTGEDATLTFAPARPAHHPVGGGKGRDETREYQRKQAIQRLPIRLLPETVEHIAARAKKQAWIPDEEIQAYYFTFWDD